MNSTGLHPAGWPQARLNFSEPDSHKKTKQASFNISFRSSGPVPERVGPALSQEGTSGPPGWDLRLPQGRQVSLV